MELWIRVQKNKQLNQGLVKVEDLILEKYNANEWSIRQSCDTLAIYKTEKRALEVLDEIQKLLMPVITYTQKEPIKSDLGQGIYQIKQDVDLKIQQLSTYVYEMSIE